jgi:hypothetical protein
MSHDTHRIDGVNRDLGVMSPQEAQKYYLEEWIPKNFASDYPDPMVIEHNGVQVVRDDLITGTKCRGGEVLLNHVKTDTLVYVQPRVGLAGVSILACAEKFQKNVVLFMPASQKISYHQACTIERGATPIFRRIAAMPNLNKWAAEWATENGAEFIPLGLRHPAVTAGLIRSALTITPPDTAFVATSTGVLTRALQIAWPNTRFVSVCVARNMKEGELGRAVPFSSPYVFQKPVLESEMPPFPTVMTYDAKAWKPALEYKKLHPKERVLMWNVGKDPVLNDHSLFDVVDSQRDWNSDALVR